jgi:predicted glycosyltransferase
VLGLRDIVDAPERVQRRGRADGEYDTIERFYDSVLVYGEREVFDLTSQYLLPPSIAGRLRYCGYVCAPEPPRPRTRGRVRRVSGMARAAKLIAVMAGGGADSYPVMRACLGALPAIRRQHRADMVLHTGPFMPRELLLELQHLARALGGVRVSGGVSDTLSSLQAADLVVGMCGYNTTVEVLRSRRPSILIPRAGPRMEQRIRAGLFAERGWVQTLDPELMGVEALAALVVTSLLQAPPPRCPVPRMRGLAAAADDLLSTLVREPTRRD